MNYTQKAQSADAKFRQVGQLITLTIKTKAGYANGAVIPGTETIVGVWGIETGVTAHDLGVGNVSGTLIQTGDRKLTVSAFTDAGAALPALPLGTTMTVGAKIYVLGNAAPLNPGGVPVLWYLIGRG